MMKNTLWSLAILSVLSTSAYAAVQVDMQRVDQATTSSIGSITLEDSEHGLLITPHLHDLPAGLHGFHLHTKGSCAEHGLAAKGHFDPKGHHQHLGPYADKSHLGDLPPLIVNKTGQAILPILAPKLTEKDVHGHALMIHAGEDNYSDTPKKLGGGGKRIACGVIK